MLAIVDVHYFGARARAACVIARRFDDAEPVSSHTVELAPVAAYVPGQFFERELPCLLAVLKGAPPLETIVIDGYVWLDAERRPGLGAHLYEALERRSAVIGVAKTAFKGSPMAEPVLRPSSRRPLYVTSAGLGQAEAAARVRSMHGAARIPTLVALADRLSRAGGAVSAARTRG